MIGDRADIIIEIKGTINVMHFNRFNNICPTLVHGKIVFHKVGPWCQKVWEYCTVLSFTWASQVALVLKNLPANAGDIREVG